MSEKLRDSLFKSDPQAAPLYYGSSASNTEEPLMEEEEGHSVGTYAKDIVLGIPRGAATAVEEIVEVGNIIPGISYNLGDDWLGTSKTAPGGLIEGVSNFAAGFIPIVGWAGKAGKLSKVSKLSKGSKAKGLWATGTSSIGKLTLKEAAVLGAVTDFAVFDAHDARLSDLMQQFPVLQNPISEYLASDMTDSELEGRLKNAAEGVFIGGILDLLVASVRKIRKTKDLRSEGKSPNEVDEATQPEQSKIVEAADKLNKEQPTPDLTKPKAKAEAPPPSSSNKSSIDLIGKTGSVNKVLDDLEEMEGEKAIENLTENFKKDGVLLNINTFRNGKEIFQDTIAFINRNYDAILKAKKTILLDDSTRKKWQAEWKDLGLGEAAEVMGLLTKGEEQDALLFSATAALRMSQEQMGDAFKRAISLREQIAKASEVDKPTLSEQLAVEKALILQFDVKQKTMVTAIGAVRTKLGQQLQMLNKLDDAYLTVDDLKNPKAAGAFLDAELALRKTDSESLDTAIDKAIEVYEKHGAAGMSKLGLNKNGWDVHNELWINALLSGPRTSLINFIGNGLTAVFLPLEKALGAHIQFKMTKDAKFAFTRDALLQRREAFKLTSLLQSIDEAFQLGRRAFREEDTILQPKAAMASELNGSAISQRSFTEQGGVLGLIADHLGTKVDKFGKIVRVPTRFLTGTDEFFKQLQFRHMARAESMIQAYEKLAKSGSYDGAIPAEAIADEAADIFEGIFRANGERYSKGAIRREAHAHMKNMVEKTRAETGEELDQLTRLNIMNDYYDSNWSNTKGDVSDSAFAAAQEATFTRPQEGVLGKATQQLVAAAPWMRLIMPFVSTPLNIIKFFGERTFPMISDSNWVASKGLHKRYVEDLKNANPVVQAAARGRMATGVGLWMSAIGVATAGGITGRGPERKAERDILRQTGWQPYSFKTPMGYISYQRLDPFATFFGMAADMTEFMRESGHQIEEEPIKDMLLSVGVGLAQNVLNKSYMTGVQQTLEAASEPQANLGTFMKIRAGSYVPALFGQAVGSLDGDEALRESRDWLDAMQKKIPGAASNLDPKRNVLGETAVKGGYGIGVVDYVLPFMRTDRKKDIVFDEMAQAQYAFSMPSLKLSGAINMAEVTNEKGQSAYDRLLELQSTVKINGKSLRQRLGQLIQSEQFQRLSGAPLDGFSTPRADAIKRQISKYRRLAKKKMLKEFPSLEQQLGIAEQINYYKRAGDDATVSQLVQQLKGLR